MKTIIHDAEVVTRETTRRASIVIEDGRIADIIEDGRPVPDGDDHYDASDLIAMPGAIDDHVHFRDPGLTRKATMLTESAAAVAGGVCTVLDMPNTKPQTITREEVDSKLVYASKNMHTNYSAYIGATNNNMEELLDSDYMHVCGVKVFMGSSTGGMLVDNDKTLEEMFRNVPVLIAAHCEDEAIIRANSEAAKNQYGDEVPWREHANIRSAEACMASSRRAAELARSAGARLHIMHITTAAELSLLDSGADRKITGEACPAHLWFTKEDYDTKGPYIKCNPAIKEQSDRDALRRAVASGLITAIGTDHAPHTRDEKEGHPYWQTPSGMPMIEHSLPLMMRLADEGWWSYNTVAARMAADVAELYDIKDRGHLAIGEWADIALLRRQPQVIDRVHYKCGWTPLKGESLNHTVVRTYVSGRLAYTDGNVLDTRGRLLDFWRKQK